MKRLGKDLYKRESFNKLVADLCLRNASSREEKARMLPSLRNEIQTLVTSPAAFQPEAIEGILLGRFFGASRSSVQRNYKRPTSTWSATQPVSNTASTAKVISIPELLEAILSHLPLRSLLRSTEVSKAFRNLMSSSPTLQKNLFMLARKEPLETLSLAGHNEPAKEYKIATLCPLLQMDSQSHLTAQERFESDDCESVEIRPCAAHANYHSHMYLTNPPCVEVDITMVYTGSTAARTRFPVELAYPATHFTIVAQRKIRNEKGVTFAMLLEARHMKGKVYMSMEDRVGETDDEGTPNADHVSRPEVLVLNHAPLHHLTRVWEEKHRTMMCLDGTDVRLHGVVIRTAADFAATEKADRDAKMEGAQRKIFQGVLLELMHRTADRAETMKTIETAVY